MKVIFLKPGSYSIDARRSIDVSQQDVDKVREFDIQDADFIENYVYAGLALLPCMNFVFDRTYNPKTKHIEDEPHKINLNEKKKPGRKPKGSK